MPAFFMLNLKLVIGGFSLASFLAATIIPIASEALLIVMLSMGYDPFISLDLLATMEILWEDG